MSQLTLYSSTSGPSEEDLQALELGLKLKAQALWDQGNSLDRISNMLGMSIEDVNFLIEPPKVEQTKAAPPAPVPYHKPPKRRKYNVGILQDILYNEWFGKCYAVGYAIKERDRTCIKPGCMQVNKRARTVAYPIKRAKINKYNIQYVNNQGEPFNIEKGLLCYVNRLGVQVPRIVDKDITLLALEPIRTAEYRPDRDKLKKAIINQQNIDLTMRNGFTITGILRKFSQYELLIDVAVDDLVEKVIVFVHSLSRIRLDGVKIKQAPKRGQQSKKVKQVNIKKSSVRPERQEEKNEATPLTTTEKVINKPSDSIDNPLDLDIKILPAAPTPAEQEQLQKEDESAASIRIQDLSAEEFRRKRMEKKMTQVDLAKALGLSAGSASNIGNIEKGRTPIPPKHYKKLQELLL